MKSIENTRTADTPLIRKSNAWMIQAVANAHKYKTILYLRDELDLSWSEIARRMNYCEAYVQRTYARAYMLMGKEVKPSGHRHSYKERAARAASTAFIPPLITRDEMKAVRDRIRLEKYRTVIFLREEKQLIFSKISGEMGFSTSYVKALYRDAISKRQLSPELFKRIK